MLGLSAGTRVWLAAGVTDIRAGFLRHVFACIADHSINRIDALLPWRTAGVLDQAS
jgi:hypothetical protein